MSREARRTESPATRHALAERDLDVHDEKFAAVDRRDDEQDERLDKLEATKGANRTAFWSLVGTIVTAAAALAAVLVK